MNHKSDRGGVLNDGSAPLRIEEAKSVDEWSAVRDFRRKNFFDRAGLEDPYTWTFNHVNHRHFLLYGSLEIIGYAHIQLWPNERAAMRIIVIEAMRRNNHLGSAFLELCEQWLKRQGYHSIHVESSKAALGFYKKNKYREMPFNDPDGYKAGPLDIAIGKVL